jgi:hyaluronan synthase
MAKQQYRWARGSQYNTLRMLPWMLGQAPVLAFFFAIDIVIPFLWICSAIGWGVRSVTGYHTNLYGGVLGGNRPFALPVMVCLILASSWVSMSIRQQRHLEQCPGDIFFIPLYVIFSTLFLLPIRLYGFLRMAKPAGWGTRANAYAGGHGGAAVADNELALAGVGFSGGTGAHLAVLTPVATRTFRRPPASRFNPYEIVPIALFVLIIFGGVLYDTWPG